MFKFKKLKNYMSDVDKFLRKFNRAHPELSESQKEEIDKLEPIFKKRDQKQVASKKGKIWERF